MIIPSNTYLVTKLQRIPIMIISLVMLSGLVFGIQTSAFAASAALLNNTGVNPTSAASGSIGGVTVTTDKTSYSTSDIITISGTVQDYISGTPIGIKINDPRGDLVKVESVDVKSDRTFFATITDDAGTLWQTSGMYKVTAVYGSIDREAQTVFQFIVNGQSGNTIGGGPPNPNGNQTTAYQIVSANSHNVLTVKTDLPSYNQGDTIIITGHVNQSDSSTAINLRVTSPSKNLVFIGQILPSSDGSFAKTLPATGSSWTDAGTYTITAQYGLYTYATVQFHYSGGNGQAIVTPEAGNPYLGCPDCNDTSHIQQIPPTTTPVPTPALEPTTPTASKIPHWVKTVFNLYGQGQISDDDLISALKFLIQTGVIRIS